MLGRPTYDGKLNLLDDPEQIAENGYISFLSALWFYMTPQSPKPSMHEVVTGLYVPSASDLSSDKNIKNGFGATIAIINGGKECNQCSDSTYIGNLGTWEHLKTLPNIDIYDKT